MIRVVIRAAVRAIGWFVPGAVVLVAALGMDRLADEAAQGLLGLRSRARDQRLDVVGGLVGALHIVPVRRVCATGSGDPWSGSRRFRACSG